MNDRPAETDAARLRWLTTPSDPSLERALNGFIWLGNNFDNITQSPDIFREYFDAALRDLRAAIVPVAALPEQLRVVAKYLDELDDHWEAEQNASIPLIPVNSSRWAQGKLRGIAATIEGVR